MSGGRSFALATAVVALAALALQNWVNMQGNDDSLLQTWWAMARYFTILCNGLVVIVLGRAGLSGRAPSAWLSGGVTMWILLVGVVYHLLLAQDFPLYSADWWANLGLHGASPVMTTLWWLLYAPKGGLRRDAPARWLIWPVSYTVYVLVRGLIDGRYPYFFFDINRFGFARVLANAAGLALAFFIAGHGMRLVARVLARR